MCATFVYMAHVIEVLTSAHTTINMFGWKGIQACMPFCGLSHMAYCLIKVCTTNHNQGKGKMHV